MSGEQQEEGHGVVHQLQQEYHPSLFIYLHLYTKMNCRCQDIVRRAVG